MAFDVTHVECLEEARGVAAAQMPEVVILDHALPGVTPGQKVLLFLRPNEIELLPASTESDANTFPAKVEKTTYLGDTMDYRLSIGNAADLRVQTDARHRYAAGESVRVRLPRVRSWVVDEK